MPIFTPPTSVSKSGSTPLTGDVTLSEGTNVTLTQVGNDIQVAATGSGGAPTDADYLVGTANAGLSAEIVVGTTPGGELGGTWASPTVDATHSGSAHHSAVTVAADADVLLALSGQDIGLDTQTANKVFAGPTSGGAADPTFRSLVDADIPAAIARLDSPTFTGTVTVPTPANSTDASTKAYVDAVATGLSVKASCRLATAAALPANIYANGASGVGATLTGVAVGALTVDGVVTALGDRILVKDEVTAANRGIYTVTQLGTALVVYILTRATDFDQAAELSEGNFTLIEEGTANAREGWVLTTAGPFVIGTTGLTFAQFNAVAEAHAVSHTTGSDKIATGTPDGSKFLRDDFAWAAPTASAAAHAASHQADGSDSLYVEQAPDSNVTVPTGYGFVAVGPYDLTAATLTLNGPMVIL